MTLSVAEILGGEKILKKEPKDRIEWIYLVQEGLPKSSISQLANYMELKFAKMADVLPVSYRTLQRYMESHNKLSQNVSEHMYLLAELLQRGSDVFGSKAKFLEWLKSPVAAFGGKCPINFINTALGIELVSNEIGRIEYGIFS